MDYFSELLDSYKKLKKRTYKLSFINEAEEQKNEKVKLGDEDLTAGISAAEEFLTANLQDILTKTFANKGKYQTPAGVDISLWVGPGKFAGRTSAGESGAQPQASDSVIKGQSGRRNFGEVATIEGNSVSLSKQLEAKPDSYKEFIGKFVQGADTGEEDQIDRAKKSVEELEQEQAQQEEAMRLERLGTLGSLLDLDPERFADSQEIKSSEQKNVDQLDDLCEKGLLPDHVCASDRVKLQYIGGSRGMSLESKLVNGTGFVGFDANGNMQRQQIGSNVIKDTFQTNLDLLKEMGRSEPDCEYVGKRIGLVGKGKVVLFSNPGRTEDDKPEGVVLEKGGLHNAMLDRFQGCEKDVGIKEYKFKGGSSELNEIKGRFNELFMGVMTRVYSTARSFKGQELTDEQKREQLAPVLEELATHVDSNRANLQEFAGETPLSEQGVQLDSYPLMEEVDRQVNIYDNPKEIKNVMQQLLVQMGTLIKQVEADDIIPAGTAQTLGGKVDNYFLYTGPDAAERAGSKARFLGLRSEDAVVTTPAEMFSTSSPAKQAEIEAALARQGLSIDDTETQIATLSAGNKISVGGTIKFGDLRLSRGMDIVMSRDLTGAALPPDQEAYYAKLNDSLQMSPQDNSQTQEYFSSIDAKVKKCGLLSQQATFAAENGEITLTNPTEVAKSLGQKSMASFAYGQKGSAFYGACTKQIPNPHGNDPKTVTEVADFQDSEIQKKMEESLQRDYLSQQLNNDLNSDEPEKVAGATNALCKMAGATIMEMTELSQIVTEEGEDSETLVLNQNDILRGIGDARKSGSLKINISGGTASFKFKVNGQDIEYKTNMERQKGSAAVAGKIKKSEAEKAGKRVRRLKGRKKKENQETIYKFLKGQMSLIEELINEAN